ncbi:trypsin-like peptidase domain-containing protein [Pseudonocardia sp. KRD-291]|nr:trypsin-like peptidase domain-containing protein [Pseudonocardia sp. KRD291]
MGPTDTDTREQGPSSPYGQPYGQGSGQEPPAGTWGHGSPTSTFPPYGGSGAPPTSTYPPFGVGPTPPPRRPRRAMTGIVAAALAAGLVGGGVGFGGAYALMDTSGGGSTALSSASNPASASTPADGTVAGAAAKAMPSTVDIQVRTAQGTAEGSGVILTSDGDVLTNNHVVSGAEGGQISVTLADGSSHAASVVGTSPSYDLAVIKLQGVSGLTAATLGQSGDVRVGEQVVAIGSPQGLSGTVTAGIVSAQNRTVTAGGEGESPVVYNGLQTDAPINQGNSGGPLVNLAGQVVGINSAIATSGQNAGSIGLGFAIPVDQARRVAQELMTNGTATKPQLGVQGAVAGSGSGAATAPTGGAQISTVAAGSAAEKAGLRAGDVVTKVGDAPVSDFTDLVARIGTYAPGENVTLTVTSGGDTRTVPVTLGSVPDQAATTSSGGATPQGGSGSGGGASPFGGIDPFGQGSPLGGN